MKVAITGIGNALVDILINLQNDNLLSDFNLPKGSMQLVDAEKSTYVNEQTNTLPKTIVSGGSAANTIHSLAKLGVPCSFIGKIGNDEFGSLYENDMIRANIKTNMLKSTTKTGIATAFVSPDSERTFATYLGAAVELTPDDILDSFFEGYQYLYIEGYLVQNHALLETAAKKAKQHGLKIVLDLASYNVVESNLEFLKDYVKNYVDIVFANEEEAKAFTGKEPEEALNDIAEVAEIAVVKIGSKGSLIKMNNEITKVPVDKIKAIDTTGAGDSYAAGFLFGLVNEKDPATCGRYGSILAARVIQQLGARIPDESWSEIETQL